MPKKSKRRVVGPKKGQYRVVRKGKRKGAKRAVRRRAKPPKPIWLEWNWQGYGSGSHRNYPVK